jgi:tetratricopeptide (TPR) repeat protein
MNRFRISCGSLALLIGCFVTATSADEVRYATGDKDGGTAVARGTVVDYSGQYLVLRTGDGAEQKIPADRVLEIVSERSEAQQAGAAAQANGDFQRAVEHYLAALRIESRGWVQREIIAQCVRCYLNSGRPQRACAAFLELVRQNPQTPYFSRIPLRWMPFQPSSTFRKQARGWLEEGGDSIAPLLAASWLLSTADRANAIAGLQRLSLHPDSRVVQLARAQLWRTRVMTAEQGQLSSLQKLIERMPPALRGGPYYVLGRALAAQAERESAALAFLRVPILYPDDRQLAASALLSAGRELEKIGRTREAATLYREAAEDYAGTDASGEAAGRLKQLLPDGQDESP